MRRMLCLAILLVLAHPGSSAARLALESRVTGPGKGDRAFQERIEQVLAHTEKRIRAVFGMDVEGKAVVVRSQESFDLKPTGINETIDTLLINSEVARSYSTADLQIACARSLYWMVWPKFRKPFSSGNALLEKLYVEGMTAYAAELLYPGAKAWTYTGLYGKDGKGLYKQYVPLEKGFAEEVQRTMKADIAGSGNSRLLSQERMGSNAVLIPAGKFLSYRIIKTFEKDMDPKMIQLMDFNEFRERLPAALEKLHQGFGRTGDR